MIGILVQLAISWLIAWWFTKKNLSVLGFRPTRHFGTRMSAPNFRSLKQHQTSEVAVALATC